VNAFLSSLRVRIAAFGVLANIGTFLVFGPLMAPIGVKLGVLLVSCHGEGCPQVWAPMLTAPPYLRWALFYAAVYSLVLMIFYGAAFGARVRTAAEAFWLFLIGSLGMGALVAMSGHRDPVIGSLLAYFPMALAGSFAAQLLRVAQPRRYA
jgi:hypothetical protein